MRIVLRNVANGRFLASAQEKRWTPLTRDAQSFKRSQQAVETAEKLNLDLKDVELVFQKKHEEDMVIRLSEHGSTVLRN